MLNPLGIKGLGEIGIVGVADPFGPGSFVTATAVTVVTPAGKRAVSDADPLGAGRKAVTPTGLPPAMTQI